MEELEWRNPFLEQRVPVLFAHYLKEVEKEKL